LVVILSTFSLTDEVSLTMTMIKPVCLHDRAAIAAYLQKNVALHIYEIGDLDDFFWQYTTWYAHVDGAEIKQIALVYTGTDLPILLGLSTDLVGMQALISAIMHLLPRRIYTHQMGDSIKLFEDNYTIIPHGTHYRMLLTNPACLDAVDTSEVVPISVADQAGIQKMYDASYPGNWLDVRMLETNRYFGIQRNGEWISVSGIHVYSPRYGVAALGNITTLPQFRGQGLATATTAKLCQVLLQDVDHIGLNVKADNASAIACYKRLGFEIVETLEEYMLEPKDFTNGISKATST
jgi:RimJ/RimL family protein N-acetyltransferase